VRRAAGYRGDAAVTTWLHRIVVNACLDRLRRASVRGGEPLPDDDVTTTVTSPDPPTGPERAAELAERRDRLLAALRRISPDQRAALVLVDMEGMSVEEAAAILEVPAGTVKSRCARGRTRLALLLTDLRPDAEEVTEGNPPSARPVVPEEGRS